MKEPLHKDSQAHAVIRAPGKRPGWGLSGIRDGSRDGRSGLSGQAQPAWQGNTEIRCVRCFRRKERWLADGNPVLPGMAFCHGGSLPSVFFRIQVLSGSGREEAAGACSSVSARAPAFRLFFVGFRCFQRAPGKQKGRRSSDRRPCDGRWRKGRDLNPRYRFKPVYSLSRRAPSADSDTFPR